MHFTAGPKPEAQLALEMLIKRFGQTDISKAEVVVALGGDGSMLAALRERFTDGLPVYGIHRGSVGFLMNDFSSADDLPDRINTAERAIIYPLSMQAETQTGEMVDLLAINEVSLLRQSSQTAKLKLYVDDKERIEELACDGILVATPAGSTAYNLSAHGPILPIGANLLALTAISPFRPRRWRGALLRHDAVVRIEVVESDRRRVAAFADNIEVPDIRLVEIRENKHLSLTLLFDEGHALDERILREQFAY